MGHSAPSHAWRGGGQGRRTAKQTSEVHGLARSWRHESAPDLLQQGEGNGIRKDGEAHMPENIVPRELSVDDEFQSLIPPLSYDEYERLEKSIIAEGVRDPIITWNGTIIDGHNRYGICKKHGIGFKTTEREFESRDAAKIWIIENQFGRRNLSKYDRSVLALQLEPLYAAEAKRRSGERTDLRQKSDEGPCVPRCVASPPPRTAAPAATRARCGRTC